MRKIFFYCQHQLGIGHLTRSLNIARALVEDFEVHFVQGGTDIGLTISHPHFNHYFLTPVQMTSYQQEFYNPNGLSLEDVWKHRLSQLEEISSQRFDYVITELFPLGRKLFRDEVLPVLDKVKTNNSNVKIFCAARDILVDTPEEQDLAILNKYYDKVFIHSDPEYYQTPFESLKKIVIYTGYISSGKKYNFEKSGVIVSLGGGAVGEGLLKRVFELAQSLPKINFLFVFGINNQSKICEEIQNSSLSNINWTQFDPQFEELMARSQLSINMGGYNTLMNTVVAKTFSLSFPYDENNEQKERIELFEKLGLSKLINLEDLSAEMILEHLNRTIDDINLSIDGQDKIKEYLLSEAI